MKRDEAIELITRSSIYGNLGLLIGAGMSMAILNDLWGSVALSWKELINKCAKEFKIDLKSDINTEGLSFPEIATEIAKIIAENDHIEYDEAVKKLKIKISELTSWYPENVQRKVFGKILEDINPNWIITTNYDLIIECLLTGKSTSLGPNDQLISPKNLIPIYHLHGIRTNPNSIVITQEDYISLFRPNQYRQQKLSLSIKESTTLIIGYGLGDVNVLTAVDWSKNVYSNQSINYPNEIIQLYYSNTPKKDAYRDRNNIIILEFDNLQSILQEISDNLEKKRKAEIKLNNELKELNNILKNPKEKHVSGFIDDPDFRKSTILGLSKYEVKLISGFLELFSKSIDETWRRAEPNGAFHAYDENLIILLDILEYIELSKIPPALFESVVYHLDRVSSYIGTSHGQSRAAYSTWIKRRTKLPKITIQELKNISKSRGYTRLKILLRDYS